MVSRCNAEQRNRSRSKWAVLHNVDSMRSRGLLFDGFGCAEDLRRVLVAIRGSKGEGAITITHGPYVVRWSKRRLLVQLVVQVSARLWHRPESGTANSNKAGAWWPVENFCQTCKGRVTKLLTEVVDAGVAVVIAVGTIGTCCA